MLLYFKILKLRKYIKKILKKLYINYSYCKIKDNTICFYDVDEYLLFDVEVSKYKITINCYENDEFTANEAIKTAVKLNIDYDIRNLYIFFASPKYDMHLMKI